MDVETHVDRALLPPDGSRRSVSMILYVSGGFPQGLSMAGPLPGRSGPAILRVASFDAPSMANALRRWARNEPPEPVSGVVREIDPRLLDALWPEIPARYRAACEEEDRDALTDGTQVAIDFADPEAGVSWRLVSRSPTLQDTPQRAGICRLLLDTARSIAGPEGEAPLARFPRF